MLWQGRRESDNVEDRRGKGGGMLIGGGIGTIIIGLLYVLLGGNPSDVVNQISKTQSPQSPSAPRSAAEEKLASVAMPFPQ